MVSNVSWRHKAIGTSFAVNTEVRDRLVCCDRDAVSILGSGLPGVKVRTNTVDLGLHRMALQNQLRNRDGQILVIAVVAVLVLLVVAALTIDAGFAFCTRAELQNAADAAALAGAQELVAQREGGHAEAPARSAAAAEAQAFVEANSAGAGSEIAFGTRDGNGEFIGQGDGVAAAVLSVRTFRDANAPAGPVRLFFAPLMGVDTLSVTGQAECETDTKVMTVNSDLSPFAVYEGDIVPAGQTMTFYEHEQVVPGCYGLLDFNGGAHGTPELREWILYGYDGGLTIDPELGYIWVGGDPGFRASLKSALEERLGDPLVVCVYDQVTGQGSNAQFRVTAFLGITLTDFKLTGNNKYIRALVMGMYRIFDAQTGNVGNSPNVYKIQLVR